MATADATPSKFGNEETHLATKAGVNGVGSVTFQKAENKKKTLMMKKQRREKSESQMPDFSQGIPPISLSQFGWMTCTKALVD